MDKRIVRIWYILVALSLGITLWYLSIAGAKIWRYGRLSEETRQVQVQSWRVVEKSSSSFAIESSYVFCAGDRKCQGSTEFAPPYFMNYPSASGAIDKLQKTEDWTVWYSKKDCSINSLQKVFPFKECIHAFLTLAISIYFFFLKSLLSRWYG